MPLVHDRCVCLRRIEYSETSQILLIFSREHGTARVIAKGAHRRTRAGASKFDGGVDLLDIGDTVFTHDPQRELGTLAEWSLREGHPDLRRNLRGLYLGMYAAELVAMLIEEHDPHPQLFDRMEQCLLELGTPRAEESFLSFELDLLRETGYLVEMNACAGCGQETGSANDVYFSPASSGVVCRNCEGAFPDRMALDVRLLRLVQGILRLPRSNGHAQRLPRLTRHQTDPINRLFAEHVEHMLGRRLRMPSYVLARTMTNDQTQ